MARLVITASRSPEILNVYDFCNPEELMGIIKSMDKNISGDLFLSQKDTLVFTEVKPSTIYEYYCYTFKNIGSSQNGTSFQDTKIFQSKTDRTPYHLSWLKIPLLP